MIHTYCINLEEFNSYRSYNVYISRVLSDILNVQYDILYNRINSVYTMIKPVMWYLFVCTGAHIIDLMILVVDISKGVQTQTAECLVIGEITCDHMIVVLNKVDLVPQEKREAQVEKVYIL